MGALCGEAVVFPRGNAPAHFLTQVKQHGALLAKGRLLGVQFDALFTDDLYFQISAHAIAMAEKLKALFREKGYPFLLDSPTNQQFIILEKARMAELQEHVSFGFWEDLDETHAAVRFAASWSTTEEDIQAAEAAARDYYAGTVFTVEGMEYLPQGSHPFAEGECNFTVTVRKDGAAQEDRLIQLDRTETGWAVVNEGY